MRARHALAPLIALAGCDAAPPVTHTVQVESRCAPCGEPENTTADGTVFVGDDGHLTLFTDFALSGRRTAMLEVDGIDGPAPEVRYHEVAEGRVTFHGEVDAATVEVERVSDEPRVDGHIALEVHDPNTGEARTFPVIRVFPADRGPAYTGGSGGGSGGGGGGGSGGGARGGSTQVVVVVQPAPRTYTTEGGCEGDTTSGGGCEGDTTSGGGCEGDTTSGGGCEGDTTSGGGCDSSSASGCEADGAARAAFPGLFRLLWPIATVAAWNRRRRWRRDQEG